MYKKLMFLISFVCLLVLAVGAHAEELEVPWGETGIIDDYVEVGSFKVEGCLIVEGPNGHLFSTGDGSSSIDGDGTDGPGGAQYAQLVINNGGRVTVQSRFNIGCGSDGRLIVNNGYFSQECCGEDWEAGFKFPDDPGGEHFIIVNNGEVHAYMFEQISDRHAKFELGCAGKITMDECEHGHEREDPFEFEAEGDLYCLTGCAGPVINYVGSGAEAFCVMVPDEAWNPDPADGEDGIPVGVVCTWSSGKMNVPPHVGDKHYLFFGTNEDDVNDAGLLDPERCAGFKPVGLEELDPDVDCSCTLVLWTNYYWRIDEKPFGGDTAKGNVWSFTTGCEIMPGDINLDCVVNLLD